MNWSQLSRWLWPIVPAGVAVVLALSSDKLAWMAPYFIVIAIAACVDKVVRLIRSKGNQRDA